jgi:hypothetical protein
MATYSKVYLGESYYLNAIKQKARGMFKFKTTDKGNLISSI